MLNLWQWGLVTELLADHFLLQQMANCQRLFVGFSGGLDSTVLLHMLVQQPQLAEKITAVYVNHGLSQHADEWQAHCMLVCQQLAIPFLAKKVSITTLSNIEEQARKARIAVFDSLVEKDDDALVLGHHRDDQAETLLLQLFRGAGINGLAAMESVRPFGAGLLFRPCLHISRSELQVFANTHRLCWINDESNQDRAFSRNFLRHEVIPLLQTRWPKVIQNLARTASHCLEAKNQLSDLAHLDYSELAASGKSLLIEPLRALSPSRRNNVLRSWLRSNTHLLPNAVVFDHIIKDLILASKGAAPKISWAHYCLKRYKNTLYLLDNQESKNQKAQIWFVFPEPLFLGSSTLIASKASQGLVVPENALLELCFRQGGESFFWHGQSKSLKKLFQEWRIPVWEREQVPLLYINGELAAVVGYAVGDRFYRADTDKAWVISIQED